MLKCNLCKKPVRQFKGSATGNLTRRYYYCKNCRTVFIEHVYVPYTHKSINDDTKIYFRNVIGDTDNLTPFAVFKTIHYHVGKRTVQATLV